MSERDTGRAVVKTVFIALVLDLMAFTMPLPLFPRLIAWYLQREAHSPQTLLAKLLGHSDTWRRALLSLSPSPSSSGLGKNNIIVGASGNKNWDVVLLGGAMGSLFSLCQCVISPWLGRLSDRYGRKRVLLATMLGNILSAIIWVQSTTFASFLLSRLVGGLSEGNVQLSTAIISDVTTPATRSKALALVGIAFSICLTVGPSLGAYFATRPVSSDPLNDTWNVYAAPALISLVLLVAETTYLAVRLPETRFARVTPSSDTGEKQVQLTPRQISARLKKLRVAGTLHGLFLLFFSGAEFTLTFLTYDMFAATNAQNGRMLSFIGILSALLQARHVRPSLDKSGELRIARRGVLACTLGLGLLSLLPLSSIRQSNTLATIVLYAAASCLAYTSATVVTGLTAAAASYCDETSSESLQRGRALGGFRSKGQLGRAVGPLLASSVYWLLGPTACYAGVGICLAGLWAGMRGQVVEEGRVRAVAKEQ